MMLGKETFLGRESHKTVHKQVHKNNNHSFIFSHRFLVLLQVAETCCEWTRDKGVTDINLFIHLFFKLVITFTVQEFHYW